MADVGEKERIVKKRKIDISSPKEEGSPSVLESPKHIRSPRPSALNIDTFKGQFPSINMKAMRQMVGKFSDTTVMDSDALYSFIEYIFLSVEENNNVWYGADGFSITDEMSGRPLHLVFFASICKLSRAYWLFMRSKEVKDRDARSKAEVITTHLQVSDALIPTTSTDQDSPSTESWTEDVILNYEVNIGRAIPDIMVKGFCESFLRESGLDPRRRQTVEVAFLERKLRTVSIIELKDESVFPLGFRNALCQCASYAIHEATKNMAIHKDKVIYLLVCSEKSWGFGTIKITGMKKGDGEEHEHPEGEMFIYPDEFRRSLSYTHVTEDDCLLIQSLLRLMLGDSFLQISSDDALEVIRICEEEKNRKLNLIRHSNIKSTVKNWNKKHSTQGVD